MKPGAFDYYRPSTMTEAAAILSSNQDAKIIAGGQTLGPMLNLRLSQPTLLVDITRIPEGKEVTETANAVTYGGCITHANIEDGRVPDPTGGFLRRVARGIAYRAVRTRGTIGGSLAHADPAADWISALSVLEVEIGILGPSSSRSVPLQHFITGALSTCLGHGEILASVSVAKQLAGTRFGYAKICRKVGEFGEATGVVRRNPDGKVRIVAGASAGLPIVIEDGADFVAGRSLDQNRLSEYLLAQGLEDGPYERAIHTAAIQRALDESWQA
ncbi:MAG: FAD binding domain-containing protein [Rhodomicrobium sp.]